MQQAFEELKKKLYAAPVLFYPDFTVPLNVETVETDESNHAVGAVYSQKDVRGGLDSVQFVTRKLNEAEKRYFFCEKEALVVVFALK